MQSNSSVWFYSDPHFDHTNIIRYCNRPFLSVADMNKNLLCNYHNCVKAGDTVYFLGDITFGRGSKGSRYWLRELVSPDIELYYIIGSHDNGIRPTSTGLPVVEVVSEKIVDIDGEQVLLIHDPAQVNPSWKGWVVHGHVHNYRPVLWQKNRINVSCDVVRFRPVTVEYIAGLIRGVIPIKEAKNAK